MSPSESDAQTAALRFFFVYPLIILFGIVLFMISHLDGLAWAIAWIAAVLFALPMLGFFLALWRVVRFRYGIAWLVGAGLPGYALGSNILNLSPSASALWTWFGWPLGLSGVISFIIAWPVLDNRSAKLKADAVAENARSRTESQRRDIKSAEDEAMNIAREQDVQSGKNDPKFAQTRALHLLKTLWNRVDGKIGWGCTLNYLSELSKLSLEQTFRAVRMLEDREAVTTNRLRDKESYSDFRVYLAKNGADIVWNGESAMKKKEYNIQAGWIGTQVGGTTTTGSLGNKNQITQEDVGNISNEEPLEAVYEAIRALRGQLSESHQIEAIDAQVEELEQANDTPARRSALERLHAMALMLGPVAKPLLDIIKSVMEMWSPKA